MAALPQPSRPLDEQAVWLAGWLYDVAEQKDDALLRSLVASARQCQRDLHSRMKTCSATSRIFLLAALDHLERALNEVDPFIPFPQVKLLPATIPDRAQKQPAPQCPFCGQPKQRDKQGIWRCESCIPWLAKHRQPSIILLPEPSSNSGEQKAA